MAITLRTVTGSALTYEQVNTNFSSLIHSASISGNQLTLHYTSSAFAPGDLTLPIESASYAETSSETLAIKGLDKYVPRFSGNNNIVTTSITTEGPQVHINPQIDLESTAILQIDSSDRGVLFPKMTSANREEIINPAEGLMVFDKTLRQLCIYLSGRWCTLDITPLPNI